MRPKPEQEHRSLVFRFLVVFKKASCVQHHINTRLKKKHPKALLCSQIRGTQRQSVRILHQPEATMCTFILG